MNIKKEVGERIKRLRKNRGLTQEMLAELVDISPRNLSNIEQGISFPKPETLEKFLNSLNTTTEELFANEHIKASTELINSIYCYINKVKDDKKMLELIYKILRDIIDD